MNHSFKALGLYELSLGEIKGTILDLRVIFSVVLKANATNIMIKYNHASGNISSSEADKYMIAKIREAV
ncbi:JAB domain-containing protein [Flavobacterium humidisoli]|uniref:JAB domain-containing protein n=1 Tax=Flavobacterium humidisoli TaxID=2937442 RepID=UPI003B845EA3